MFTIIFFASGSPLQVFLNGPSVSDKQLKVLQNNRKQKNWFPQAATNFSQD